MRSLALSLLLLAAAPATANPYAQMRCLQGDLSVYAHALVLVPTACTYDYAFTAGSGSNDPSRYFTVDGKLNWGVRIGGRYTSGCWLGGLAYQWYGTTETSGERASTDTIFIRETDANGVAEVTGRLKWRYQTAEGRLGRRFPVGCGEWNLFGAVRWVDVGLQRTIRGVALNEAAQESDEKSQFCGGGLGFGVGADLPLLCDISLIGEIQAAGIIGSRRTPNASFDLAGDVIRGSYPSTTAVVPQLTTRIGLAYHCRHGMNRFSGFLGFELDHFYSALAFPLAVVEVNDAAGFRTCQDVGFSGIFFGASTTF